MENKIQIREMQKADIPKAAEVLGKAYATNPAILAVFGGNPTAALRMQIAIEAMFKYLPGRYFVAEYDGQIAGGMQIAKAPDCQAFSLKVMPAMLRAGKGLGPLLRIIKLRSKWAKHDPHTPHWHGMVLGITPEFQHKGIGSQWENFYCDLVDKDGIEAYHETDRSENVPFYEKFGFKVVGEEIINGAKSWYMLRPAK